MRLSLSIKFSLLSVVLVVLVAGATSYLMVFRFGGSSEQELISRDRELARVLAGLRTSEGKLDFGTLQSFVGSSDRVDTGLVYVMEVDASGALLQGALNARLFSGISPEYAVEMQAGRKRVLEQLAAGRIERQGRIKEYSLRSPAGEVRLGFNLQRIRDQILEQQRVGLLILLVGLSLGVGGAVILARRLTRPVKRLAGAMEAVARGDVDQTVQVSSRDEIASLADSFNQMTRALREKKRVREVLSLYLSSQVIDRILREANPLEMIPEQRAVTVVSLCLRGYAELAWRLPPRESVDLLNDYLAPVIDAIAACEGHIDQIDGPRVVAVWGAPAEVLEPELKGVRAALAARAAVFEEGRRQVAAGGPALRLCAGVSSGRALAGNVGSARRVAYQVLGGAAELARQIERIAQPGEILVSEATYGKVLQAVEARAAAPLILEGMEEAVPLYRVEAVTGRS